MSGADEIARCPCYHICAGLGLKASRWCRYRKSDLPPPGVQSFDPEDDWCPTGVQATVLMLRYMLSEESGDPERLKPMLDQVRTWARELRRQPAGYDPARSNEG